MKRIVLLLLVLSGVLVYGCKKEKNKTSNQSLIGYWQRETLNQNTGNRIINAYSFSTDGTFRAEGRVHNSGYQILGYQSLVTGKYRINGNKLELYNQESYYNDFSKGDYTTADKLVKTAVTPDVSLDYKINAGNQLEITYPCPPNAFCIGTLTYNSVAIN